MRPLGHGFLTSRCRSVGCYNAYDLGIHVDDSDYQKSGNLFDMTQR